MDIFEPFLADLLQMPAKRYLSTVIWVGCSFGAAMTWEKVLPRAIALAVLLYCGAQLLILGVLAGTMGDVLMGLTSLGMAGYAWWYTRI